MLKIKKIEVEDLSENIIGKYITNSDKEIFYKVVKRYEGELSKEILLELESNLSVDDYILLRDYYILEEE